MYLYIASFFVLKDTPDEQRATCLHSVAALAAPDEKKAALWFWATIHEQYPDSQGYYNHSVQIETVGENILDRVRPCCRGIVSANQGNRRGIPQGGS